MFAARRYVSAVYAIAMCLSIYCLSVTSRNSIKTARCITRQPTLHNSLKTPAFDTKDFVKFELGHPNAGTTNMVGKIRRHFHPISGYMLVSDGDITMEC